MKNNECPKIKSDDLEFKGIDGGGIPIYHHNGKPFSGVVLEYYGEVLDGEIEYVNGYQEGAERNYYKNGSLESELMLKDNKLHGVCSEWDEEGNLITQTVWENGVKIQ